MLSTLFLLVPFWLSSSEGTGALCHTGSYNFTDDGNGHCYSPVASFDWYPGGHYTCGYWNAYMYDIHNAFENNQVQSMALQARDKSVDSLWLGLTCTTNSITSCQWDDGRQLKQGDYTNFDMGQPNVDVSPCVAMRIATGKWYSFDCLQQAYVGCQYTPGISISPCYDDKAYYFRGDCFFHRPGNSFQDAESVCNKGCGVFGAIHSLGENTFFTQVANQWVGGKYTLLALEYYNNTYNWVDGSPTDYLNFGYENENIGSCVALAFQDDVVPKGKWINSQCSLASQSEFICKKKPINGCDYIPTTTTTPIPTTTTTPHSTTPPPTMAPLKCTSAYFENGRGYIYSPGYPYPSGPNTCEYFITQDPGLKASIDFQDFTLDKFSFIYLYSSVMDPQPFATINTTTTKEMYYSATNALKVVFTTPGNSTGSYFRAFLATHI